MNRSEELCKLLGIEPTKNYKYLTNNVYGEQIIDMTNDFEDMENYDWGKTQDKTGQKFRVKKVLCDLIYPDLTKPSNFVKLLDLLNAYLDIRCDCLMAVVPQIIDKAIFLASTNSSRFIEKKDKFKKQAQQTEWEY